VSSLTLIDRSFYSSGSSQWDFCRTVGKRYTGALGPIRQMGSIYGKGIPRSGLPIWHGIFKFARMSASEMDGCNRCKRPVVEIDHYGERLVGCVGCNRWMAADTGLCAALPIEEISALRERVGLAKRTE